MKLKVLVGSGDKIGLVTLPFLIIGLILNIIIPSLFSVGGPSIVLKTFSIIILIPGITIWIWSVVLILIKVPQKELITNGPYSLVKHPLYTGVALLVLPWIGFLLNTCWEFLLELFSILDLEYFRLKKKKYCQRLLERPGMNTATR